MKKNERVIIIGGGLSGLSTALYLSKLDLEVYILEKNSYLGGKAGTIKEKGFTFDSGPSLMTMKWVFEDLFKYLGNNINDYLELYKLDINCNYFYGDGTKLTGWSNKLKLNKEISKKTSVKNQELVNFQNYTKKIYDLTENFFLYSRFKLSNFFSFRFLYSLIQIKSIDPFRTLHQSLKKSFKDSRVIKLYSRYATFNGSNPYKTPATLNIISHVETLGAWFPKGGIREIPKSFAKLAKEKRIKILLNSELKKLYINQNRQIKEIAIIKKSKIKKLKTDYLVYTSDIYNLNKFLPKTYFHDSLNIKNTKELSSSAIIFYWGVEGIYSSLDLHNIIFCDNYENEFKQIFEEQKVPEDPTIYINISSKMRQKDAPKKFENWFVMINTPPDIGQNWELEVANLKRVVLNKINKILDIDIKNKIVFETYNTPKTLALNTGSYKGSLYGKNSNHIFSAFVRPTNKSKKIKNLFFAGGSVHPGGGMPLAVLSGKFAAQELQENLL